jgi:hypothetical protein
MKPPAVVVDEGKRKVAELVSQPDRPPFEVPMVDGKPAWFQAVTATGQKVPITKIGTGLDIRPNNKVQLVVFKTLQSAVNVNQDARIGDTTLGAFKQKIRKRGFIKYPTTVAELAANAVKYTEILRKNIPVASVGGDAAVSKWSTFARAMAVADVDEIGHNGRLGHFAISPRRMEQLGLMENVGPVELGNETLYTGECVGFSIEEFMESPRLQLDIFSKSTREYAKQIRDNPAFASLVGRSTPVGRVTLSGLLALANIAGLKGAAKWVMRKGDAAKFPHTTAAFKRANGIF